MSFQEKGIKCLMPSTGKTRRGRIPGEGREVCSLDFPKDPEYPRLALDLKCLKADIMEGERERKMELGEEIYGRSTKTHEP